MNKTLDQIRGTILRIDGADVIEKSRAMANPESYLRSFYRFALLGEGCRGDAYRRADAEIPVRLVVSPKKGKDGLFAQPDDVGPEREMTEHMNRLNFAEHFHYADQTTGNLRTFDPKGDYSCGGCNKYDLKGGCLLVPIKVSAEAGSCEHWEDTCAGDREIDLSGIITAEQAAYGVADNGKGFGCARCPYASKAVAPDSRGRDLYCGKGDFRVPGNACCALNGAPATNYDGNKPLKG